MFGAAGNSHSMGADKNIVADIKPIVAETWRNVAAIEYGMPENKRNGVAAKNMVTSGKPGMGGNTYSVAAGRRNAAMIKNRVVIWAYMVGNSCRVMAVVAANHGVFLLPAAS